MGSRDSSNDRRFFTGSVRNNFFAFGWSTWRTFALDEVVGQDYINTRTTMSLNWLNNRKVTFNQYDEDLVAPNDVANGRNITLFGINGQLLWKGRIYNAKISDGDKIIADLRPCLHPKTFEACMYDTVSKKYLYNQGTGEFIPAPRFVEYIQSTGTQYINTGVHAPDVTRFVIKGTCSPNGESNAQLLGAKDSSLATSFFGSRSVGGKRSWYCVVGDSTSIGNPLNLSIIDATIIDSKNQSGTLTDLVEDTTQSFDSFVGSASSFAFLADNLCIFGGSGVRVSPNATCYDLQLYTADGLVRHFKPCLRGNTPCMFDMVEGKYYLNAGTGEFIVGGRFVEYIESTGTQYIDLGLKLNQNSTVEVEYCYHTKSSIDISGRIFGARYTSSPRNSFVVGSDRGDASPETKNFAQFGDNYVVSSSNIVIGQWNTYKLSANGFYINGVVQGGFSASTFETPFTIKLFAFEQAPNSSSTSSIDCGVGRCKQLKIWNDNTIVRHFIPALDPNNIACMYDIVTSQYFYNQGTGEFKYGELLF